LGNLISDCSVRASFTGARATQSRSFSQLKRRVRKRAFRQLLERATPIAIRKNGIEAQRRVTKQERRRDIRLRERTLLERKNGFPRRSDRRRRETHRSSWLRKGRKIFSKRTERTTSTGAVGQVVGGIRRQHASRYLPEAMSSKEQVVSHVSA